MEKKVHDAALERRLFREVRLLAKPVDWRGLVQHGLIQPRGEGWYWVPRLDALPRGVTMRVCEVRRNVGESLVRFDRATNWPSFLRRLERGLAERAARQNGRGPRS